MSAVLLVRLLRMHGRQNHADESRRRELVRARQRKDRGYLRKRRICTSRTLPRLSTNETAAATRSISLDTVRPFNDFQNTGNP